MFIELPVIDGNKELSNQSIKMYYNIIIINNIKKMLK
jgi:hypothetical protein